MLKQGRSGAFPLKRGPGGQEGEERSIKRQGGEDPLAIEGEVWVKQNSIDWGGVELLSSNPK